MIWLRSALFNAWFFGLTLVLGLVSLGVRAWAPARALGFARMWAGLILAGARVICGIRVGVTGLERLPAGAALLASQHQSAFDALVWAVLLPKVSYVYKAELARIPLFGPMLVATGQIPLDRTATLTAVRKLLRAAIAAKEAGRQIVIFPEGTRVAVDQDSTVRGGFSMIASRTGLPVYPVATDSGCYWGRRAFRKFPGCIRITVCEPIAPDLPGPELVRLLKARWRQAALTDAAVDKPVDARSNPLTSEQVNTSFEPRR